MLPPDPLCCVGVRLKTDHILLLLPPLDACRRYHANVWRESTTCTVPSITINSLCRPSTDGATSSDFDCKYCSAFRQYISQNYYDISGRQYLFVNRGATMRIMFALRLLYLHTGTAFSLVYCLFAPCTLSSPWHVPRHEAAWSSHQPPATLPRQIWVRLVHARQARIVSEILVVHGTFSHRHAESHERTTEDPTEYCERWKRKEFDISLLD